MTYIFYTLSVFVGLVLMYFGIYNLYKYLSYKEIAFWKYPISESNSFEIKEKGLYSISILGGKKIVNLGKFKIEVYGYNTKEIIPIEENKLMFTFKYKGKDALEYSSIELDIGKYDINIFNHSDLLIRHSKLRISNIIHQKESHQFEILIRSTIHSRRKIISIIALVIGANMFLWSIVMMM